MSLRQKLFRSNNKSLKSLPTHRCHRRTRRYPLTLQYRRPTHRYRRRIHLFRPTRRYQLTRQYRRPNTPVPPTNTPVPPPNTPVPPTNTPVPPTNTPVPPTNTPVPPTNTPVPPTNTPVPPTNTPVPPENSREIASISLVSNQPGVLDVSWDVPSETAHDYRISWGEGWRKFPDLGPTIVVMPSRRVLRTRLRVWTKACVTKLRYAPATTVVLAIGRSSMRQTSPAQVDASHLLTWLSECRERLCIPAPAQ